MYLKYVTFTGVDKSTDLERLKTLSEMYPWIEWGILLYNPKQNKFPPLGFIEHFVNTLGGHCNISVHICGELVPATINFTPILYPLLEKLSTTKKTRLQLNFNAMNNTVSIPQLQWFIKRMTIPVITQVNENNKYIHKLLTSTPNTQYLYDASGGHGKEISKFEKPLTCGVMQSKDHNLTGYAGGINADNLFTILGKIGSVVHATYPTWIDMESSLRTDANTFSISKCIDIIDQLKDATPYLQESYV